MKASFLWERLVATISVGIAATSRSHRLVIAAGLNGAQLLNLHEYRYWIWLPRPRGSYIQHQASSIQHLQNVEGYFRRAVLALLARKQQEHTTTHYCPHAGPDRDVDRLFLRNRHLERAQLDVVSLLGIAELAIQQRHYAGTISTVAMIFTALI